MFGAQRLNFNFSIKAYNSAKNYYKILNISETANQNDIKKAFHGLAKKYHPDSAKGKEDLFKEINEAYQVLSDQTIKKEYDQVRAPTNPQQQRPHSNPSSTYQQSYKPQGNYQQQQSQYRGYQPEQGWNNKSFRQQYMNDLHRRQQNDYTQSQFDQARREQMQRLFKDRIQVQINRNINETIRQYKQQARHKNVERNRKSKQEERKRQQQQYEEYRRYRDESYSDSNEKLRQQLNKFAEGVAANVKDTLKMAEELKNWWLKHKDNNKK